MTGKYGPLKPPSAQGIEVFEKVLENHPDADMRAVPNQWLLNERGRSAELGAEVDRLLTEVSNALTVARELECMILSGAKSKRAYDKMGGLAEGLVSRLQRASGRQE